MIMDSESCENIVLKALVKALGLSTMKHSHPHKVGQIKRGIKLTMNYVCQVPFFIRRFYKMKSHVTCWK